MPILLAALAVHVVRRNVFDVVVFGLTVVVIGIDRYRRFPVSTPRRAPVPSWLVAAGAILFGVVIGATDVAGWPVRISLAVAGIAALWRVAGAPPAATGRTGGPAPAGRAPRGWLTWAGLLVLAALLELSSFLQQPDPQTGSYDHPTLSTLIEPLLGSTVFRMIALAIWLAAGCWLVRACLRPGDRPPGERR